MNINIKNAKRLETSIDGELDRLQGKIRHQGSTEYKNAKESMEATNAAIEANLVSIDEYLVIRKSIRDAIGKFNKDSGIDVHSSEIALLQKRLSALEDISDVRYPRSQRDYGTDEIKYSGGLSDDQKEVFYARTRVLTRQIQRLKDKCQGVNATGTIELADGVGSFLRVNGLMD